MSGIREETDTAILSGLMASISHGSSGSPIFNSRGPGDRYCRHDHLGGQNLNFAIPIDYAKGMLASPSQPKALAAIYEPDPEPE